MAWNNANEIVVGSNGQVYVAPVGTPLPANVDRSAQRRLRRAGLHHRGRRSRLRDADRRGLHGVAVALAGSPGEDERRRSPSRSRSCSGTSRRFRLRSAAAPSPARAGNYRYDLPKDDAALDERALVLDAIDGAVHHAVGVPPVQRHGGRRGDLPARCPGVPPADVLGARPGRGCVPRLLPDRQRSVRGWLVMTTRQAAAKRLEAVNEDDNRH